MIFAKFSYICDDIIKNITGIFCMSSKNYDQFINTKKNRLTIKEIFRKNYRFYFKCLCDCGVYISAPAYKLIDYNMPKSCLSCAVIKHGHNRSSVNIITATYKTWSSLRNRCNNPKNKDYINYGARGINVCERWNKFENFLSDMGEKPYGLTIDRINNDGNYEPSNCRWATYKIQNNNQRRIRKGVS